MNLQTASAPSRAIVLSGEHAETSTPAQGRFDRSSSPIRLLADAPDNWRTARQRSRDTSPGVTFEEARQIILTAALADGTRTDRGLGAADRLVLDTDPGTGILYMTEAATRGGQLAPLFAPVPVRATAFRQICGRIKAPAPYLARLPAGLALANLSHGLRTRGAEDADDATALLRLAGGEARAIVSSRYAALDDAAFLDAAHGALVDLGISLATVRASAIATGARTALRLTFPHAAHGVTLADGSTDTIEVGLDLTNGELGNASASVTPLIYRLVCTNGLRAWAPQGSRRAVRHIGDPRRAREMLRDAIPAAIDDATGAVNAVQAASKRVVDDAAEAFGGLRIFGLTAAEARAAEGVLAGERGVAMPSERKGAKFAAAVASLGPVTVWDVTNGITAMARTLGTERRLEVESAAGEYLRRAVS